jgi:antitoxin component HigA of HigAB toxin-antitoxin module
LLLERARADMQGLLGHLIEGHESQHHSLPDAEPVRLLSFHMDQLAPKQADLAPELDSQLVVNEIL